MRMLLTSGGVRNPTIHTALVDLLDKPTDQCRALGITTASYGHPMAGPGRAWDFVANPRQECPMAELGWKSLGLLELSALPSLGDELWHPWIRDTDVLLVNGGDAGYLAYWMRESGLAALLPTLDHLVWVGLSAGSMVMTPRVGQDFLQWPTPGGSDAALGLVDFSIFPHLDHPALPENTLAAARRWAADIAGPAYAIDDDTAIRVDGDRVDVVSEGQWHRLDNE